jgi:hypothetical protein
MARNDAGWLQPWLLVEAFAIANLGFLVFDIYLAHSVNSFRRPAEYVPLYFSAAAPVILLSGLALRGRRIAVWKYTGFVVGWSAIGVGLTGTILHLDSSFFYERTVRSLTYSAPFAAPLAYAGLGFLLLLNRMLDSSREEWARWVLFLTLGGFVGNFIFSLADHAENGFYRPVEWTAVIASALAVGFLVTPLLIPVPQMFLRLCAAVMLGEAGVGVWGFVLHAAHNLQGPSVRVFDNFIYGAPPMAPLLFPNLVALGLIALWRLNRFSAEVTP